MRVVFVGLYYIGCAYWLKSEWDKSLGFEETLYVIDSNVRTLCFRPPSPYRLIFSQFASLSLNSKFSSSCRRDFLLIRL